MTAALDTSDLDLWSDEDRTAFAEHMSVNGEGSHRLFAKQALASGDITLVRKSVRFFFEDRFGPIPKSPPPPKRLTVLDEKPQPKTLEEWEDAALRKSSQILENFTPEVSGAIATKTGETPDEVRRRVWKAVFMGNVEDSKR